MRTRGDDMAVVMSLRDLIEGLRDGRLGEQTARAWLAQEAAERRTVRASRPFSFESGPGQIRAHSNKQAADIAHQAVDRAFGRADQQDEYSALFNPRGPGGPLGPPIEDD